MLQFDSPEQNKTGGQGARLRRDIRQIVESSIDVNPELYLPVNIPRVVAETLSDKLALFEFRLSEIVPRPTSYRKSTRISAYF